VGANNEEARANGDAGAQNTETQPAPPAVEYLPVEEDRQLWSFAYTTAREAWLMDQQGLFFAFRQLELTFESRYGYPFITLLGAAPGASEDLPLIDPVPLTPTPFATADYLLYIYDLPTEERLILYLNPLDRQCMGFNLLRY
jgi:hypothetical protein